MTEGYTISDLAAMKDLQWHNRGWYHSGGLDELIARELTSNLQFLIDKGHPRDVAERAAIRSDLARHPGSGYREIFTPPEEVPTHPTDREWLLSLGYETDLVDSHLAKIAEEDRCRAVARAEREAFERTWRYRVPKAWREAKCRMALAWDVLRRGHECEEP